MEKSDVSAFTPEELKKNFDDFVASLTEDEKKILAQSTWDEQGTPFEKGLFEFLETNSDGSDESNAKIQKYYENLSDQLKKAESSGDAEKVKFFQIVSRMKLPIQVDMHDASDRKSAGPSQTAIDSQEQPSAQQQKLLTDYLNNNKAQEAKEAKEPINLKAKIEEIMNGLEYSERNALKEARWKENSTQKWKDGFYEYLWNNVYRDGKEVVTFGGEKGFSVLRNFLKEAKKDYDDTSESKDPEGKLFFKAQKKAVEKMLGVFSGEKQDEKAKNKEGNDKQKGIWSWENIKFTMRNIRRQVFELVGTKDPWWDYTKQQGGLQQIETKAGVHKPAGAAPTFFNEYLDKRAAQKSGSNGGGHGRSTAGGADTSHRDAA